MFILSSMSSGLVVLLLELPSNFIVSGVRSSRWYRVYMVNVTLFSILFIYIVFGGLLLAASCFWWWA